MFTPGINKELFHLKEGIMQLFLDYMYYNLSKFRC